MLKISENAATLIVLAIVALCYIAQSHSDSAAVSRCERHAPVSGGDISSFCSDNFDLYYSEQ